MRRRTANLPLHWTGSSRFSLDTIGVPLAAAPGQRVLRSPMTRAPGARLKPRRGDLIIAQGKRGTSAALGYGSKRITSPFFRVGSPAKGEMRGHCP